MKIMQNCYFKYHNVDIVFENLPRKDYLYASPDEKKDFRYSEEFCIHFDHNTHEIIENGSGINLVYDGECFDGFDLDTLRNEGHGEFLDSVIEKCREALFKELGIEEDKEESVER